MAKHSFFINEITKNRETKRKASFTLLLTLISNVLLAQIISLGGTPPRKIPEKFAPEVISHKSYFDFAGTFSPDFKQYYFSRRGGELKKNRIFVTEFQNGKWSSPKLASFSNSIMDFEPFICPNGNQLYFGSSKRLSPDKVSYKIWHLTKKGKEWTNLQPIDSPFDSLFVMYVSFSNKRNMYYTGKENGKQYIFESQFVDGKYKPPEKMSDSINIGGWIAHPYIAPNENYMIYDIKNREDSKGSTDLYISFKNRNGRWKKAINMGDAVNTEHGEMCASVSPDGKYLFFCRYTNKNDGDIYWVSTSIIDDLKNIAINSTFEEHGLGSKN